ncbi:MAG: nucleotidyltransferase domain-containing protein [Clostridia bacterium]|nr:nucleotidyltransferase domain-containing protein [Clostridia bacterium]
MSMQDVILQELQAVEHQHDVHILYAAESGSRAWGFASPDSDYDVRFVYVRRTDDYLRLDAPPDTIEWKLDETLDINGWDLRKALRLTATGNSTLFEWAGSPIVYLTTETFSEIMEHTVPYFSVSASARHYRGIALSTYLKHLRGDTVKYKKYFYALRPLLCVRYIEANRMPPPVPFDTLLKEANDFTDEEMCAVYDLLERKKAAVEGEESPHLPVIQELISRQLQFAGDFTYSLPYEKPMDLTPLNTYTLSLLRRLEKTW